MQTVWEQRPGHLSMGEATYALAVQLAARDTGFWERRRITSHLVPDALAYFGEAWELTSPKRPWLLERLGLGGARH